MNNMEKKYFEYDDSKSSKFWEITISKNKVITRYGKIGSNGQQTEKTTDSSNQAQKMYNQLIAEKTKKGYAEVNNGSEKNTSSNHVKSKKNKTSSKISKTKDMHGINKVYMNMLKNKKAEGKSIDIKLPTGELFFINPLNVADEINKDVLAKCTLNKKVPPGTYKIDTYYYEDSEDDYEVSPTSLLNFIVININDEIIESWEEISEKNYGYPNPISNVNELVSFLITDKSCIKKLKPDVIDAITDYCSGDGIGVYDKDTAIVFYIGEVAVENRFYWALNKNNQPIKLVGYFRYSDQEKIVIPNQEKHEKIGDTGMVLINIMEGKKFSISIPDPMNEELKLLEYDDACYIKFGKNFSISVEELTIKAEDDKKNLIKNRKKDILDSGLLKRFIIDEPNLLFWEESERPPADFRFFTIIKTNGKFYEITAYYPDGPFNEAASRTMMNAALTFKLKE